MILETVRIVADWLDSVTTGVNTYRTGGGSVPLDTGVTAFPAVTVRDSTRDGRVARGQVPPLANLPALLVTPADQPIDQAVPGVRPWPPDALVTVLVRYACKASDTAAAERDTSQTLRAVWRCIGQLMVTTAGETARTRNSVQLQSIRSLQMATLYEANEDVTVTGGVLVTCQVRDTWAHA